MSDARSLFRTEICDSVCNRNTHHFERVKFAIFLRFPFFIGSRRNVSLVPDSAAAWTRIPSILIKKSISMSETCIEIQGLSGMQIQTTNMANDERGITFRILQENQ